MSLDPSVRATLNDPALQAVRDRHLARLEALFGGERLDRAFVLAGIGGQGRSDPYRAPEAWVEEALTDLAARAAGGLDEGVFRPLVVEFGPWGVHFVDRIFGARVDWHEDQWWNAELAQPVGCLEPPELETNETWSLARRLAEAFVAAAVTVPLFGLATVASPLNVAVNLFGERFLAAVQLDPRAARHDLEVIAQVQGRLHQWYRDHLPPDQLQPVVAGGRCQPPGFSQICGCTTQLLSAAAYRDLVADLDAELLGCYGRGGMIHLCGAHLQHLATWRAMPELRAVQVNDRATEDLADYFTGLRDDQVLYVNPTPTTGVERALEITGGRRLVLAAGLAEAPALP